MTRTQFQTSEEADVFDNVPGDDGNVIRRNSRSFAFASYLLPSSVRADVHKLYAWCRWCDDAVDAAGSSSKAKQQLSLLRADVIRIYQSKHPEHRASAWLADLVAKYEIDREYPLALLDGMEMDLDLGQISTESELRRYCYCVAGVVGLMMCKILGVADRRALRHAKSLGIAMQLTNIARDVLEDDALGRCYIPQSWLPQGASASTQDRVRASVRRILDLADTEYAIGNRGMCYLPAAVRPAIRVAAAVYREIGMQIRRCDHQVLQGRIVIPKLRFIGTAFVALIRCALQDTHGRFRADHNGQSNSLNSVPYTKDLPMNDAKYLFYLGISLTAFTSSAAFLLVMFNPKDAAYSSLPVIYAVACFAVGMVTNILAKRAETPTPAPARTGKPAERQ